MTISLKLISAGEKCEYIFQTFSFHIKMSFMLMFRQVSNAELSEFSFGDN